MVELSELTVVRCSVDQARQTRRNHFSTWGEPMGYVEDDWVHRFEVLEGEEWAKGDRYESWALVPRNDMTTCNMLAHCETFRRPSLAQSRSDSRPHRVYSYGIAGVFTPQTNRGHGYARQLLRLIHYIIAPANVLPPFPIGWGLAPAIEGLRDASFSVLYSGVGDKYYASCKRGDGEGSLLGWERQHITARYWKVAPTKGAEDHSRWGHWLGPEDLLHVERQASEYIGRELMQSDQKSHRVAILPSEALFRVHAVRNMQSSSYAASKDRHYGLRLHAANSSNDTTSPFIIYTFPEAANEPQTLEILYVQHPFPFEAVMAAAQKERCVEIKMWGDRGGDEWDTYQPRKETDSEMPCLVVYDYPTAETKWEFIEQYTWC